MINLTTGKVNTVYDIVNEAINGAWESWDHEDYEETIHCLQVALEGIKVLNELNKE